MNWSGNFREGLAREIRENNSLYSSKNNMHMQGDRNKEL